MMLGESSTENWEEILGSSSSSSSSSSGSSASDPKTQNSKDLFSLSNNLDLDEGPCKGYSSGAEKAYSEKCWRARWVEQIDGWGMEDSE